MGEPLTVLIPTYNEEENIRDCLESVKWADEILVVDSFSTDRTLDICREYTERILQHEYINSATQKNWAIPQTRHRWVMVVDADERVSEQLRASIKKALADPAGCNGFYVKRESFFMGKLVRHGGWEREYVLRLFNREHGGYQDRNVHACIEIEGKDARLEGPLYHYTYRNLDQYFEKFLRYTEWASEDLRAGSRRASWANLALRPWIRFLKMYVLRRGFLDGRHGLVLCMLAAFSVFTKYARLWEKEAGNITKTSQQSALRAAADTSSREKS